ncbi:MAG TPA: LuxR C-terminal-related transcriptional regulator [Chloroflexota bacterium]
MQTINQGFTLTMDNARSVTELCIHLDGLPLAIELAAARTSLLSPQMLLERLQQRLSLLRWDAPDLPERQHSLAPAIGWSYDLLSDQEQELFRRLGVFVGGFDLETAQGMVDEMGERAMDVLECVGSLVDKSLIQVMGQGDEHVRYTLLETIREYAWEQLEAQGEVDTTAAAHARYFLNLAEQADPQLHTSDQRTWYVRLEREHNNLSVALRWLLDRQDETALRLAAALGDFWIYRGYHTEGRQWLEEALGSTGDADAAVRTRALLAVGLLLAYAGDLDGSRVVLEEALALAQQCQDRSGIALALTRLGARAVLAREWPEGTRPLQEALRQWEELGDQFEIGVTLFYQGSAAFAQGEYERAASLYSDALARYEAIGNERASGSAGVYLGLALLQLGDLARAAQLVQEGIQMSRTIEDRWHLSVGVNAALSLIGERAEQEEQARLLGAGDALRQITGTSRSAWERVPGQSTAHFREHVEQERWEAAYRQGRSLSFDDTATLTLGMLEDFTQTLAHPQTQEEPRLNESPLSNRELEVLTQVAEGLSSKAIGKQLFISTSTVNYHLTSIFNKLGVDTRAQAVAVAAQRGFL